MRILLAALAVCASLLLLADGADGRPQQQADPLLVHTECGVAQAAWVTVPPIPALAGEAPSNASRVAVWHSLPFAAPPVGDLRWAAPAPAQCWPQGSVYDATQFRAYCVQEAGGEEDCLYLHVYVPEDIAQRHAQQQQHKQRAASKFRHSHHRHSERSKSASSSRGAPVWVYIHGGSLVEGSANFEPLAPFAAHARSSAAGGVEEGVIVVSMNYRLNMLGWLSISEFSAVFNGTAQQPVANFGLLDQQAALRWIQRNIAAFGGDPSRVTLGGQSSGGTSIFAHYGAEGSRGLFSGAISMSGSINTSMTLAQGQAQNAGVVAALGCSGTNASPASVVACLRALPASSLQAAQPASWATSGLFGLEHLSPQGMGPFFGGLPLVDGIVIHKSFRDSLASERPVVDAPLMMGNTGQEADLIPDVDLTGWEQARWQAYLTQRLQAWNMPDLAPRVLTLYNHTDDDNQTATQPEWAMSSFNADYGLSCGHVQIAREAKQLRTGGGASSPSGFTSPLYLFLSQFRLSAPIALGSHPVRYAFHTSDYSMAIENWSGFFGFQPDAGDLAHARLLQRVFADFIATGRVPPSEQVDWLPFDAVQGFPQHYNTFVFRRQGQQQGQGSRNELDYKAQHCLLLHKAGFDDRFWWVD